jgi:DnaJ-class molecular chaperone
MIKKIYINLNMDYYKILNLDKNASDNDIKKAYHNLALKYHPDKSGGDDTKFKEINGAYEVLSDPVKKRDYDNPPQQADFNIFESLFRNFGQRSQQYNPENSRRNNINYILNIQLRDIYTGLDKTLKIKVKRECMSCKLRCLICNGNGVIQQTIQQGPFIQQIQTMCNNCNAKGFTINKNESCVFCLGSLQKEEIHTVTINIARSCPENKTFTFPGLGEQIQSPKEHPGDLVVSLKVLPDPHFIRENDHLIYHMKITLVESIIGKQITIPHFEKDININTNMFGILNPNKRYHIKKMGLNTNGDLIFVFEITYPEKVLSIQDLKELQACFEKTLTN